MLGGWEGEGLAGVLNTAPHFPTSVIQRHILGYCSPSWSVPSQNSVLQTLGIKVLLIKPNRAPPKESLRPADEFLMLLTHEELRFRFNKVVFFFSNSLLAKIMVAHC